MRSPAVVVNLRCWLCNLLAELVDRLLTDRLLAELAELVDRLLA